jgi:ankyrin repeat domain-containing protein 50
MSSGTKMAQTAANTHQYTNSDYTVGWICALPIELAAARGMLDHKHAQLPLAEGDKNAYTLGQVGQHCVVMTCLPQGTMGTSAAATVATDLTRSFSKLRFILMVGIGGGAPDVTIVDSDRDLRLGDVVVSKPMRESGKALVVWVPQSSDDVK